MNPHVRYGKDKIMQLLIEDALVNNARMLRYVYPTNYLEVAMPSVSPKQARTMRAAAHDPKFAKKMGIPQKVAKEYAAADKRKKKR